MPWTASTDSTLHRLLRGRFFSVLVNKLFPWPLGILIFIITFLATPGDLKFSPPLESGKIVYVIGQVVWDQNMEKGNSTSILMTNLLCGGRNGAWAGAPGQIIAVIRGEEGGIRRGDRLFITGKLIELDDGGYLVLGKERYFEISDLPEPFSKSLESSHPLNEKKSAWYVVRNKMLSSITAPLASLNVDTSGFLKALLFGLKEDLSLEIYENFKKSGMLHILALSGMHLGILTGIILLGLKPILGKMRSFIPVIFFLLGYLYLTGLKISLVRAAVMFFLLGLGPQWGRRANPIRVLGITFIIAVLAFPDEICTAGFQLSFGAILGIFVVGRPLAIILGSFFPSKLGRIGQALGISMGAQMVTLPILLFHFGEIYVLGFLFSIVITPLVTVFIMVGLVFLIFGGILPVTIPPFKLLLESLYEIIRRITSSMVVFPPWSPKGKMIQYFLVGAVLALLFFWRNRGGINSLRFSRSNKGIHGRKRACHDKKVRSELFDKPGSPEKTSQSS